MNCRPNDPGSTHYACDCPLARIAELEAELAFARDETRMVEQWHSQSLVQIKDLQAKLAEAEAERDAAVAEANDLIITAKSVISEVSRIVLDCEIPPCSVAQRLLEALVRVKEGK